MRCGELNGAKNVNSLCYHIRYPLWKDAAVTCYWPWPT